MAVASSKKLADALRDKMLVRFSRPRAYDGDFVDGYVLDIGPRWYLLAVVSGGIRFDGFQCFRLNDIRELQVPHPYAAFVNAALKVKRERFPTKPRVRLDSIEELLVSAGRAFPSLAIHREKVDPEVCQIGKVLQVKSGRVALLEINPDATWDTEPRQYRLGDITRVDFGGDYEETLLLVADRSAKQ